MRLLSIDPGARTGIVLYDPSVRAVLAHATLTDPEWPQIEGVSALFLDVVQWVVDNDPRERASDGPPPRVIVEGYMPRGNPYGWQSWATTRLEDRIRMHWDAGVMTRQEVCKVLGCMPDDAKVRLALQTRFGANCFDRGKACPKRKNKSHGDGCPICGGSGMARAAGVMSGVKRDTLAALALAVAWSEVRR